MPPTTIIRIILKARTKNFICAVDDPESDRSSLNLKRRKSSITAKFVIGEKCRIVTIGQRRS
jgi:hypothetical protein